MLLHFLQIGVFLLTVTKTLTQSSAADSTKYIGAVVEYHPLSDGDDRLAILESNAKNYRTIIKKAAEYKVDIIVFPEYGLTRLPREGVFEDRYDSSKFRAYYRDTASYVPHPNESVVLCDSSNAKYTKIISCAAREYGMYVVVNHHERADCPRPDCSPDGFLLYNTNVVFDRSGKVIARYRKSNLFNEDGTDVTETPERSVFRTDFGVIFGQFICADILFEKPANFYARNPEVTDVIFSTRWYGEAPFFGPTEIQAAWAHSADVNFLASCYSNVSSCSGGSGIYAGKSGPIRVYHKLKSSNALIIAEIPKLNRNNRTDVRTANSTVYEFKHDEMPTVKSPPAVRMNSSSCFLEDMRSYTTQLLDPIQGTHVRTLCDRGLCCDFHIEMTHDTELTYRNPDGGKQYRYRLVAFNGVQQYDIQQTASVEVCALLNCVGDALEHCEWFNSPVEEDASAIPRLISLTITRRANLVDRSLYMPMTLTREYAPLANSDFVYLASGHRNSSLLLMHLTRSRGDLLTFGILGRRFDRDGEEVTKPTAGVESVCHVTDGCDNFAEH